MAETLESVSADAAVAAAPHDHRVTVTLFLPGDDPIDAVEAGRKTLFSIGVLAGAPLIAVDAVTEAEHGSSDPRAGP